MRHLKAAAEFYFPHLSRKTLGEPPAPPSLDPRHSSNPFVTAELLSSWFKNNLFYRRAGGHWCPPWILGPW